MCVLTSEGERMVIGRPAVVIERIPAGTRDGVCGLEPAINQLGELGGTTGVFSVSSFAR